MRQVVQPLSRGAVEVMDVPRPIAGPTEVLVKTHVSVISSGTERALVDLARSNPIAKARRRPDLVRQVMDKAARDGIIATARAVRSRLDGYLPLGYSAAGLVIEVGAEVEGISPGQLVATGGAGKANHAEYQAVPALLCSPVPDGVGLDDAVFTTVATIPLHGLRLADISPGARVVVIGLGLLGQICLRLARAAGCRAMGLDIDTARVERAQHDGSVAYLDNGRATTDAILRWTNGFGADSILITAGGSSSEPVMRAPAVAKSGGTVVIVGDVGLNLKRAPFYEKQLTLRFARSYGPGRYDKTYEEWGVDYPFEYVRWTEARNAEAVLELIADGRLRFADLITHRFEVGDAGHAYDLISAPGDHLGVLITYSREQTSSEPIKTAEKACNASPGIGVIGAGAFTKGVLIPSMKRARLDRFVAIGSQSGLTARQLGNKAGFERAVSGATEVIHDPEVDAVVISTPHSSHASLTVQALQAGKHVFCEKPLALTFDELEEVERAWSASVGVLFVGFNRRWSAPVRYVRDHFAEALPLVINYRINAGAVSSDHWYRDRREGGRLIGEVCHFIDTCAAIIGEPATKVVATRSKKAADNDYAIMLEYPGGSLSTITYASGGHPRMEKERIEVLGGGSSATIVDFRSLSIDGRKQRKLRLDKGHVQEMRAFAEAIHEGSQTGDWFLSSSRTTLEAAAQLTAG